jgi:hypothetical protein
MAKKRHVPQLVIQPRRGATGISTGANTLVTLDGKRLGSCYSVTYECDAKSIAYVTLKMYAQVTVKANVRLRKSARPTNLIAQGKHLAIYTLSNHAPRVIATGLVSWYNEAWQRCKRGFDRLRLSFG